MRGDLKKGNCRPHPFPGPPYHLGVGVIVEASLGVIVVARCLIILVGRDVRNSWGGGRERRGVTLLSALLRSSPPRPPPTGHGYSRYWL